MLLMIYAAAMDTKSGNIITIVTSPVQKLSAWISGSATDFFSNIVNSGKNAKENDELREEVTELREQLIDYEDIKDENEQLKEMLGIKDQNKDYDLEAASVIGRDPDDRYGSFQIDKGSVNGVELYDPVINRDGLIGYIGEISLTSSKVITLLSPDINVGAYGLNSGETGVVTGDNALSQKGFCKLRYLLKESNVAKGELVVSSGYSGVFPKGLIIGTVEELKPESGGVSVYAEVKPAAQIETLKQAFVLKDFKVKGEEQPDKKSDKNNDVSSGAASSDAVSSDEGN